MLNKRVIPTLLIRNRALVKTCQFNHFAYVGDPVNTVRIFNELEVDEILVLDISPDRFSRGPDIDLIDDIASHCFMPLAYGGAISSIDDAAKVFGSGVEKVVLNTCLFDNTKLATDISNTYGSQSLIASIDVRLTHAGYKVVRYGHEVLDIDPMHWALELQSCGVGEILLTSVDNEGTWLGLDINLIALISSSLSIPLIAHGGAGTFEHIRDVFSNTEAEAVAVGSMVVFLRKGMGVLVHSPCPSFPR
jgi:cyclase